VTVFGSMEKAEKCIEPVNITRFKHWIPKVCQSPTSRNIFVILLSDCYLCGDMLRLTYVIKHLSG